MLTFEQSQKKDQKKNKNFAKSQTSNKVQRIVIEYGYKNDQKNLYKKEKQL